MAPVTGMHGPRVQYLVSHTIRQSYVQSPKLKLQVDTQKAGTRGPGLVSFSRHEEQGRSG